MSYFLITLVQLGSAVTGYFVGKLKGRPVAGALGGLVLGPIGVFIACFAEDRRPSVLPRSQVSVDGPGHRQVTEQSGIKHTAICTLCGRMADGMLYPVWRCKAMRMPARYHGQTDLWHHRGHVRIRVWVCGECAARHSLTSILAKSVGGGLLVLFGVGAIGDPTVNKDHHVFSGVTIAIVGAACIAWALWERRGVGRANSTAFPKSLKNAIVGRLNSSVVYPEYGKWTDAYATSAHED